MRLSAGYCESRQKDSNAISAQFDRKVRHYAKTPGRAVWGMCFYPVSWYAVLIANVWPRTLGLPS